MLFSGLVFRQIICIVEKHQPSAKLYADLLEQKVIRAS